MKRLFKIATALLLVSCTGHGQFSYEPQMERSRWLAADDSAIVSISPFDGSSDTLRIDHPFTSVVCMSSSYSAGFAEIGAAQAVSGISGLRYITNDYIRSHAAEVGNEAAMDYEKILSLKPDVVLIYGLSAATPPFVDRLSELGIRCFRLYDHMECDPLGRAEYMKAYGTMVGKRERADSVFAAISGRYEEICEQVSTSGNDAVKVLVNAPYSDAWYIPGKDSYMYRLVRDAGGEILGAAPGIESSVISLEKAYLLSQSAELWLNPGWAERPSVIKVERIYDNSLHTTPEGGNDFWERGAVRPDLVLEDLAAIFGGKEKEFNYYKKL